MASSVIEGKLFKALRAQDSGAKDSRDDSLRPMSWSELRIRLDAIGDLHEGFLSDADDGLGSFDAHSARRIAARADGKEPVNLDDLGNGKGTGGNGGSSSNECTGSDPRK